MRDLVEQIETGMEILYPGTRERIVKNTERELIKILMIMSAIAILFTAYGGLSIVSVFMAVCVMWILIKNSIYCKFDRLEVKLLQQFECFIKDVNFHFQYGGSVDEAVSEAARDAGYEMSLQAYRMYDSLSDDGDEELLEKLPNHFLMTFYALCRTVKHYGDKRIDGRSVFVTSLTYLRNDVNVEILKREKINALFMGLLPVSVLPVIAIRPISIWGIRNVSGLYAYYNGVAGKMTSVTITVITMIIASIIMKLKFSVNFDNHKSGLIKIILNIKVFDQFIMGRIRNHYRYYYEQDLFLKSVVYKYNIKELIVYRGICSLTAFFTSIVLMVGVGFYKKGVAGFIVMVSVILLVTVIAYYYEIILLCIRKRLLKLDREEEVVRFQSIILILMNMDRVTIEVILFWMEKFAVVFRHNIEKMADSITYKGSEVFIQLKDKVKFPPFERLLDCFLACDKVGIEKAFSDILSERTYYMDRHKQENEIIITNKAMIGKVIAFIPICMVIIFVLVVPFIYEGLLKLQEFGASSGFGF